MPQEERDQVQVLTLPPALTKVKRFRSVVFPAPDGPITARTSPLWSTPLIPDIRVVYVSIAFFTEHQIEQQNRNLQCYRAEESSLLL